MPRRRPAFEAEGAFALIRETLALGRPLWLDATGDSMYPAVRDGNRVLLAPRRRPPRTGDIVLARFGQRLVLHRVTRLSGDQIVLQGDASEQPDPAVPATSTVGIAVACADTRGVRALTPTLRFGVAPFARHCAAAAHRFLRGARRRFRSLARRRG